MHDSKKKKCFDPLYQAMECMNFFVRKRKEENILIYGEKKKHEIEIKLIVVLYMKKYDHWFLLKFDSGYLSIFSDFHQIIIKLHFFSSSVITIFSSAETTEIKHK